MKFLFSLSCCVGLLGCVADSGDDSMYLTGTEEFAVQNADGEYICEAPKKVLICHIPPGNPENAHNICVSTHAVAPHQEHHGDPIGPCEGGGEDPDGEDPDGEDPGGEDPGGEDPGGEDPDCPGDPCEPPPDEEPPPPVPEID